MTNLLSFSCLCGNTDVNKTKAYDGMMGYEAIICTCCGGFSDHNGRHEATEFSTLFIGYHDNANHYDGNTRT